jgi:hypothetical protein
LGAAPGERDQIDLEEVEGTAAYLVVEESTSGAMSGLAFRQWVLGHMGAWMMLIS